MASTSTDNQDEEVTKTDPSKDTRIIKYFQNNSHASAKKAASIFNVKVSYIKRLLVDKKDEIESKQIEDNVKNEVNLCLSDFLRNQRTIKHNTKEIKENNETSDKKSNTKDEDMDEQKEIITDEFDVKLEQKDLTIVEHDIEVELTKMKTRDLVSAIENDFKELVKVKKEPISDKASDSETCSEITNKHKRKIKHSIKENNKKIKTIVNNKRICCYDPDDSGEPFVTFKRKPIIYTTRLEEMDIMQKEMRYFSTPYVMKQILRQSKPTYGIYSRKSRSKVRKKIDYELLKLNLKYLNTRESSVDGKVEISECAGSAPNPVKSDTDIAIVNTAVFYNVDDIEVKCIDKKCNVVIIINNLNLKLRDVYVTDPEGKIMEYHSTKLNDDTILKQIDVSKIRLTMDACCWHFRRIKTDAIWPCYDTSFTRFLTTTHKCPPDKCSCCCKMKQLNPKRLIRKLKYKANVFTESDLDRQNKSLISKALEYKRPRPINHNYNQVDPIFKVTSQRFVFLETIYKSFQCRNSNMYEYYEISNKRELVFHAVASSTDSRCIRDVKYKILSMFSEYKDTSKLIFCCNFNRDSNIIALYNSGQISANMVRFFKKKYSVNRFHIPSTCEQCKNQEEGKKVEPVQENVVIVPSIEHTRKSIKPTLLKIGIKVNKLPDINRITPVILLPKTSDLIITCKQMPGIEFTLNNVEYQVALAIVMKFKAMRFTIKDDSKVVASLNFTMQTTSSEEFQILAHILQNVQDRVKNMALPPGTNINLVARLNVEVNTGIQTYNAPSGSCQGQNINQGSDEITTNMDSGINKLVSNSSSSNIKTTKANHNNVNKLKLFETNEKDISNGKKVAKNKSSTVGHIVKTKQPNLVTNSNTNSNSVYDGLNLKNLFTEETRLTKKTNAKSYLGDVIHDSLELINKSDSYYCFTQLMSCSKKCYAESFKSYLMAKRTDSVKEDELVTPIISNVFSLQNKNPITEQCLPSTSASADVIPLIDLETDTHNAIPSTSINKKVLNSSSASTSQIVPHGQHIIIYDPATKIAKIVVNIDNIIDNNENITALPHVVRNKTDTVMPALVPINKVLVPTNAELDIVNNIPIPYDISDAPLYTTSNYITVKDEVEDVVILDSD